MLAILALLAQDYILREPHTSIVAAYGAFRLEREDCVEHPDVAVLHYAHCFPKARLIWSSADGRVSARYEDNGWLLTRAYEYAYRAAVPDTCYDGGWLTAYRARSGNAADWQRGTKSFGAMLTRCSAFAPAEIAAYQAEFAAAGPRYTQAAAGLRSLAAAMFATLQRCTEQVFSPRHGGADAKVSCARKEGPES